MANRGEIFTHIADKYDRLNAVLSAGQDQAWRQSAVDLLPGGRLLDLGGGTGAANPIFGEREVIALDPSPEMLAFNGAKGRLVGVGEQLPLRDGCLDAVFSAYVFRNLTSLPQTLRELGRVLRPGGRAGIVDLGRPRSGFLRALHRAGTAVVLPLAGMTIGARAEYSYLHHSLDRYPPPEALYLEALAEREGGPPAAERLALERTWRMGPMGFVYGALLVRR